MIESDAESEDFKVQALRMKLNMKKEMLMKK